MAQHDRPGAPGPEAGARDAKVRARSLAIRIPALYLLCGVVWILFSDRALALLATDTATLTRLQTWKGAATIAVTAVLLYFMTYRLLHRLLRAWDRAQASETRHREMFEVNPNPMFSCDMQALEIIDANPAAADYLGWPREHLQGMPVTRMWRDKEDLARAVAEVRQHPDRPHVKLASFTGRDGRTRHVELRSTDLPPSPEGRPRRLVVLVDRTAEEQARLRLLEAQQLARLGSWEMDLATGASRFCPVMRQLLDVQGGPDRRLTEVLVGADAASHARLERMLEELASGGLPNLDLLLPVLGAGGQERLLHLRGRRIEDQGTTILRGTVQDVTEEQQTRRLLGEREQQFRELVRILPDGLMILREECVFYANPACAGLFGRAPEALIGEPLADLVEPQDLAVLRGWLRGELAEVSPRMRRDDGETFRVALSRAAARYGGQDCTLLLVRDLSEPERMRDALASGNRELQAMAGRLFSAQEDERRAISRELHDDVGQAITAIKLSVHAAMAEDDAERRREDLQDVVATADATLEKLRNLSMLLRPPQLDALGLEAALRWHAGSLFRHHPVELELDVAPLPRRPDREVEQACFRIAQEGLTNILRHAGASHVTLVLSGDEDALRLHIRDDGRGFDPAQAGGLGLVIMRERAQSVGGGLSIHSTRGAGTRIELLLPYAAHG
ncbi:PAS domain S-box protein [Pseudoxanthomonas suwonensis]|uniref:PAS domain S-box protein n=1 Tax=Pseudoxanthomonas suwonensis TaxID=314722 RepID=UPI00138ED6BB|nr:PAS domain S-box protein [Pseudoxanthomonas suwonensis]KAF1698797.1 DNA-binding protein [Pseudoxanthomonas suwonensis]